MTDQDDDHDDVDEKLIQEAEAFMSFMNQDPKHQALLAKFIGITIEELEQAVANWKAKRQ